MGARKLQKEYQKLMESPVPGVTEIVMNESNVFTWTAYIEPTEAPYNKGRFKVAIEFPAEYPFKPPTLRFITPIMHPNVNEQGTHLCLNIITRESWKPATGIRQVLEQLYQLINFPENEHPVRPDLAERLRTHTKEAHKEIEAHIAKNAPK